MANQFSSTGSLNIDSQVQQLQKSFDVMWMRRNDFTGNLSQFFFKDGGYSNRGMSIKIGSVSSNLPLPQENDDEAALPYFQPAPGFPKEITMSVVRSGIRVTRTLLLTERFGKVKSQMVGQIKSGLTRDEYLRAAIFDNAFSTSGGTAYTGADSSALCANSHSQENPQAAAWDNLSTGTLTGPNLHAARLLLRNMTNDQGNPAMVTPKVLLIRPELEQTALELTTATLKPGTAFNDPNVLLDMKVVVSPYLNSTTAWFIIGDRQAEEMGLWEIVSEDWTQLDNHPTDASIVMDKQVRSIKGFGITTSKNIVGSSGPA
jgi:hypothetical protein